GRMIATACDDLRIRLWNTATWQQTLVLEGHKTQDFKCRFTPDGDRLIGNTWDGLLPVWDVHSGRQLFTTPMSRSAISIFSPGAPLARAGGFGNRPLPCRPAEAPLHIALHSWLRRHPWYPRQQRRRPGSCDPQLQPGGGAAAPGPARPTPGPGAASGRPLLRS